MYNAVIFVFSILMFGYDLELQISQHKSDYEKKSNKQPNRIFFSNKLSQQICKTLYFQITKIFLIFFL